jgi:L-asparaginase
MHRVLLLHTGGTLGMHGEPLEPDRFGESLVDAAPEIARLADLEVRAICNLDSSDIGPEHWRELASAIAASRGSFDGFVIVHGTDTMAYTASALSFALEGFERPVVLTGAQRPLASVRTDARRNLADAVELATRDLPEVVICFDGVALRGCRTTKASTHDYRAFASPGCEALARLGVDIELGEHVRRPHRPFSLDARFDDSVVAVTVHPGLEPRMLTRMIDVEGGPRGVVLVTFGAGTVPTRTRPIAPSVARLIESGVDVLVVSPSAGGVDLGMYRNSRALADAGAVPGGQMRLEAAVTKLMHALARFPDNREARRDYLLRNVSGELA